MSTSRRTRTTAQCHNKATKWRAVTSSSGRRSTTTLRSRRLACPTPGFRLTTGWGIINRWSKMATGQTVRHRWGTWVQRRRTGTGPTVTSLQRLRSTRRVNFRQRQRQREACQAAHRLSRRSRCLTTCIPSSTWCSTVCRISSTSCTLWTTCNTRRRCRPCTSSPCTRNSRLLNSPRQTLTPRCPAHFTPGCEVNLVSLTLSFVFTKSAHLVEIHTCQFAYRSVHKF